MQTVSCCSSLRLASSSCTLPCPLARYESNREASGIVYVGEAASIYASNIQPRNRTSIGIQRFCLGVDSDATVRKGDGGPEHTNWVIRYHVKSLYCCLKGGRLTVLRRRRMVPSSELHWGW